LGDTRGESPQRPSPPTRAGHPIQLERGESAGASQGASTLSLRCDVGSELEIPFGTVFFVSLCWPTLVSFSCGALHHGKSAGSGIYTVDVLYLNEDSREGNVVNSFQGSIITCDHRYQRIPRFLTDLSGRHGMDFRTIPCHPYNVAIRHSVPMVFHGSFSMGTGLDCFNLPNGDSLSSNVGAMAARCELLFAHHRTLLANGEFDRSDKGIQSHLSCTEIVGCSLR